MMNELTLHDFAKDFIEVYPNPIENNDEHLYEMIYRELANSSIDYLAFDHSNYINALEQQLFISKCYLRTELQDVNSLSSIRHKYSLILRRREHITFNSKYSAYYYYIDNTYFSKLIDEQAEKRHLSYISDFLDEYIYKFSQQKGVWHKSINERIYRLLIRLRHYHTLLVTSNKFTLLYDILVTLDCLIDLSVKKTVSTKSYIRNTLHRIKGFSFIRIIRDIRTSIILIVKKHFKRLSDVSGSDINAIKIQFFNSIINLKHFLNVTSIQRFSRNIKYNYQ